MADKSPWLQEVEEDATRIQTKRFNDYFEEQQYLKEKKEAEAEKSFGKRMAELKASKSSKVKEGDK